MKIPTVLKHKPVIVSENYENVDGRYAYSSLTAYFSRYNGKGCSDRFNIWYNFLGVSQGYNSIGIREN